MFTSIAINQENIVRTGPGPPAPLKVPIEADVVVGRGGKDVFVAAPIPGLASAAQVARVRPAARRGARVRARVVRGGGDGGWDAGGGGDGGSTAGTRVLVDGVLEFAITYKGRDGLVGFTVVGIPLSTFVDLPGVWFREGLQADACVSVTPAVWDAPSGPTLGGFVQLEVAAIEDQIIILIALPQAPPQSPA